MSVRQRAGKKQSKAKKEPEVVEEREVTLDDVFGKEEEPAEVKRPEPVPEKVKVEATPKDPVIAIDRDKLLRWAARLKTSGSFGAWGNGANFANHMIRDCVTVDGKQPTIEEASQMVNKFMSV